MSDELFNLENKVVIVTGGMGQLGREYAGALARRGARVAVWDLAPMTAQGQAPPTSADAGDRLIFQPVDIASRQSISQALAVLNERWGAPWGLINNAALDSPPGAPAEENGPFETYPESSWDKVIEVNLKGVFLCCQEVGGAMAKAGGGSIINVSSTYGVVSPDQRIYAYRAEEEGRPFFKPVAYAASKSGLLNLTRYLATYWGTAGVRVNCVVLGGVFNNQDQRFLANYCAKVPLGRMARADEYNGLMVFLLSPASSYMTGSILTADGGWTAW